MKGILIFLMAAMAWPLSSQAQLGKLMAKYHEKEGITVTQLDKSLYGLYEQENLSQEAREMLQNLEEVNLLSLNLNSTHPDDCNKMISQFRQLLDAPGKYKLIKSRNDVYGKQLIYSRTNEGKVSDLVVWNQNSERLDIIELRGDVQLNKIALLSKALNVNGLNSLADLSPDSGSVDRHRLSSADNDFAANFQKLREMMREDFDFDPSEMMARFFGEAGDSTFTANRHFLNPFEGMANHPFFGENGRFPFDLDEWMDEGSTHKIEKFFQSFGDGAEISNNSVEITEENGKTKLKINSQNSDITYIIDGKEAPKDQLQMPEKIRNVNMIGSRTDMKKSYLFITSQEQIGNFKSFKDGVLTFSYDNQEYRYNLDKAAEPLLVIDGRLSSGFNLDPADILQIRPVSQLEKEIGYYPQAEVIINTK